MWASKVYADRNFSVGIFDRLTMERISGIALDFTIVTAIATMDVEALASASIITTPTAILFLIATIFQHIQRIATFLDRIG